MKFISLLLIYLVTIEYIQSKKVQPIRTYKVVRDERIRGNKLSPYTVYDSTRKITLYKLQTTSAADIETMVLFEYPAKNITANVEGEWVENNFAVTYSIYDKNLNKWIEGPIKKARFSDTYEIQWNSDRFLIKKKWFSNVMQIYNTSNKKLIGEIEKHEPWLTYIEFQIKIYSNQCPDALYFFITAINDHRIQINTYDDDDD